MGEPEVEKLCEVCGKDHVVEIEKLTDLFHGALVDADVSDGAASAICARVFVDQVHDRALDFKESFRFRCPECGCLPGHSCKQIGMSSIQCVARVELATRERTGG